MKLSEFVSTVMQSVDTITDKVDFKVGLDDQGRVLPSSDTQVTFTVIAKPRPPFSQRELEKVIRLEDNKA